MTGKVHMTGNVRDLLLMMIRMDDDDGSDKHAYDP
jgi:hypothetical protein